MVKDTGPPSPWKADGSPCKSPAGLRRAVLLCQDDVNEYWANIGTEQ
jgi:hypothetical protein